MILYIDIGNSFIHYGYRQNGTFIGDKLLCNIDAIKYLGALCQKLHVAHVYYISVVPHINKPLCALLKASAIKAEQCHYNAPLFGFKNLASSQTGIDRLVNIIYAKTILKPPFMIIDAGSAVTYDIVNENGDFAGGMIAPGLGHMARALNQTAQLAYDAAAHQNSITLASTNTQSALNSGIINHMVGGYKHSLALFENTYGTPCQHIITGGDGAILQAHNVPHSHYIAHVTLLSLELLYSPTC